MTWTDFIGAGVIAFYAMIGSAFINAAITAPENCLRVIEWLKPALFERFLPLGLLFLLAGLGMYQISDKPGTGVGIIWAGLAHICLFLLIRQARRIAEAASGLRK